MLSRHARSVSSAPHGAKRLRHENASVTSACWLAFCFFFFFFNDTATTEIYPLSLHDALPILGRAGRGPGAAAAEPIASAADDSDRKSTRLNSSHDQISYAVFCLKKKKTQ